MPNDTPTHLLRPRSPQFLRRIWLAALPMVILGGCSKPPPPEGPPSDFPVPCVVGKATLERLEERLPLVGSVEAKDSVRIQSELEARVLRVGFKEGAAVKAGAVLFELDKRREEARLAEAVARQARAHKDLERGLVLLESKTIPPQEEDRLREAAKAADANVVLAQAAVEDAVVKAPFDGMMGELLASVGQFVGRGGDLATLTTMDPVEVAFDIPERFVSQVSMGQEVRLEAAAYPKSPFVGKVMYMAPELQGESRTLRVKAALDNKELKLRPGMFGVITLVFSVRERALVIPEGAILQQGDQSMVVALDAAGKAQFRPVRVGLRMAGRAEILEGMAEGEKVVVEGHQKTRPGAQIMAMPGSRAHDVEPDAMPGAPDAAAADAPVDAAAAKPDSKPE